MSLRPPADEDSREDPKPTFRSAVPFLLATVPLLALFLIVTVWAGYEGITDALRQRRFDRYSREAIGQTLVELEALYGTGSMWQGNPLRYSFDLPEDLEWFDVALLLVQVDESGTVVQAEVTILHD